MTIPFIEKLESLQSEDFASIMQTSAAHASVATVNWPHIFPCAPECNLSIARSHDYLAVRFQVKGEDLRATQMEDNGRSWEDSCCEMFLETSDRGYYNIETTCIGSVLMAFGSGRHDRRTLPAEDVAKVIRRSSLPHSSYNITGGCHIWSLDILVPFTLIGLDPENLPESIKANFYKCGDLTAHPHFLSWNPVSTEAPDFHRPEYFGLLEF